MIKIGILTFHRSFNYGAVLQAFSLQNIISNICSESNIEASVQVIDYDSSIHQRSTYIHSGVIAKNIFAIPSNIVKVKNIKKFQDNYLNLTEERLVSDNIDKATDFINSLGFDVIFAGSDEIWRINVGLPFPNLYWLPNSIIAKKISYAPSLNRTDYSKVSVEQRGFIYDCLSSYKKISVRDDYSKKIISDIVSGKKDIYICPDPTFSLDIPDCDSRIASLVKGKSIGMSGKPLIGLVGLTRTVAEAIMYDFGEDYEYCSLVNKYKSTPFLNTLSPFEWAAIYKKFTFCFTGLFHGTIFCLKNKIPFISIEQESHYNEFESKLNCLLKQAKLEDRLVKYSNNNWNFASLKNKVDSLVKNDPYGYDEFLMSQLDIVRSYIKSAIDICF